jgi:tetratricopeptide (TPR) repeat protein
MKKKLTNLEAVLDRAEYLFEKGNYGLAKTEFEKINSVFPQDDFAEKIAVCEKEIAQVRFKELVKKGRKYAKKSSLAEALGYFEEAYKISPEDWLAERIAELKTEMFGRNSFEAAKDAEDSGDYEKAAGLYEQAFAMQRDEELLLKKAGLLVKARKYEEAVSAFRSLDVSDDESKYNCGFALAMTRQYYECLKIWDTISGLFPLAGSKAFTEQKKQVQSLLAEKLFSQFSELRRNQRHTEEFADVFSDIYEQSKYLLEHSEIEKNKLTALTEYCKYLRIAFMWKQEQYADMLELLLPYPQKINTDLLELYAKTFFRIAETSGKYFSEFIMFWLTALYHEEISAKFSPAEKQREDIRERLLAYAEDMITSYSESGNTEAKKALRVWNVEKRIVKGLRDLSEIEPEAARLLCSSRFAEKFGKSDEVISFIRKNRAFFSNIEHYLLTGGIFSSAGKSLFHLLCGEHEESLAVLPEVYDPKEAEFVRYCTERVHFSYGLYCLEKGDSRFARYFESAAPLFEKAPDYEKMVIEKALVCHRLDEIGRYENALSEIHSKRPGPEIRNALSLVMVRRGIAMYNKHQLNSKNMEAILKKALKLNPENELARVTLRSMQVDIEMEALGKAINKHKMNKACKIAADSENHEVRSEFFEFMKRNLNHLEEMEMEKEEKTFLLNDFFKWCSRVDKSHAILNDIKRIIKKSEK